MKIDCCLKHMPQVEHTGRNVIHCYLIGFTTLHLLAKKLTKMNLGPCISIWYTKDDPEAKLHMSVLINWWSSFLNYALSPKLNLMKFRTSIQSAAFITLKDQKSAIIQGNWCFLCLLHGIWRYIENHFQELEY